MLVGPLADIGQAEAVPCRRPAAVPCTPQVAPCTLGDSRMDEEVDLQVRRRHWLWSVGTSLQGKATHLRCEVVPFTVSERIF